MDEKCMLKAYCEQCRDFVDVELVAAEETTILNGVSYTYPVRYGVCKHCGSKATPDEILQENQRAFTDAVRIHNGIVSQRVIAEIPKRYCIGKRPLSKVLGWGEQTYSRFLDGDVPSKDYSDTIERIGRSPLAYLLVLHSNKDMLSKVAFEKSKRAALQHLTSVGSMIERAAAYILAKTGSTSPLALQKELYYVDGVANAFLGHPLFLERCEAWVRGPVYPQLWKDLDLRNVREESLFGEEVAREIEDSFSEEELKVLRAVVTHVACYSPFVLRDITHKESPWLDARSGIPDDDASDAEITEDAIKNFFVKIKSTYDMQQPSDIGKYMQHMVMRLQEEPGF